MSRDATMVRLRRLFFIALSLRVLATGLMVVLSGTAFGQVSNRADAAYTVAVAAPHLPSMHANPPPAMKPRSISDKPGFTTNFMNTESPISEGSAWHHVGKYWAYVRTVANHAVGTQTGTGGYDDSYAYLSGFGPDQTARATLWRDPAIRNNYQEVELLLRWADTPTSARGYECNLSWDGSYAEIVRWNGPFGDFTYVTQQKSFNPGIMPPGNGDIFTAVISANTINVYLNKNDGKGDQLIVSGTDSTYSDGNPGMGFFIQGRLDPTRFGFSSYAAWSN